MTENMFSTGVAPEEHLGVSFEVLGTDWADVIAREELAGGVVLTKGQDRSVVVWPQAEFVLYAERLSDSSRSDAKARAYLRVLFSSAFDEIPDRQGRVTVPPALRDYAGLDREVVVVGNGATCEIWAPDAWNTYLAQLHSESEDDPNGPPSRR
jgi:MraZ protein